MALNWITIATVATLLLCDYSHSKTIMLFYKDSSEEQTRPQNVINIYANSMILSAKDAFGLMPDQNLESGVKIQPYDMFQQHIQNEDTNNSEDAENNKDADNAVPNDEHTDHEVRYQEDAYKEMENFDYPDSYPNNEDTDNETPKNENSDSEVSNDEDIENEASHNEDAHNADVEILKNSFFNGYASPAFQEAYLRAYSKPNTQNLEAKDEDKSQDHSEEHPKESDESTDELSIPYYHARAPLGYYPSDEDDKSTAYNNKNEFPDHNSEEDDQSIDVTIGKVPNKYIFSGSGIYYV